MAANRRCRAGASKKSDPVTNRTRDPDPESDGPGYRSRSAFWKRRR